MNKGRQRKTVSPKKSIDTQTIESAGIMTYIRTQEGELIKEVDNLGKEKRLT